MSDTLDDLFEQASSVPEAEREAWLRSRCEDAVVIAEVLALLRADARAASFLESPPLDAISDTVEALSDELAQSVPEQIGPYTIERLLGSGGMGEVYLARREVDGFTQRVAVKLLRGLPTRELIERFSRERRVLASLAHPNIAPLIDGGEMERGTPYLVMPFVEGDPIDAYCRDREPDARAVVELMLSVLDAVGHAHRRLVVHRDLKPANVLVTAEGRPMVLDFGIAKILGDSGLDVTVSGRQLMTPMYASPEQVRDEPISTASDVFTLGVLLYELLTGVHPWGQDRPKPLELARRICEVDPPAPSVARRSSSESQRQTKRALWSDLDAVVLTAIRKSPDRRYPSVDRFVDDLRRALDGRAVTARRDTMAYRASRFIGRNRVPVAAGCVAVLALLGGTAVSLWQAGRAEAASAQYLEQLTMTQMRNGQLRDLAATLVFDIYESISHLDGANPARLALVESGIEHLDALAGQVDNDPRLAIDLIRAYTRLADVQGLRTIGSVGDTAGALRSNEKALTLAVRLQTMPGAPADAPVFLASSQRVRGDLLRSVGRFEDALAAYRAGRRAVSDALGHFPDEPRILRHMIGLALQQGAIERRMGRTDDALRSYEDAMATIRRVLAARPDDPETLRDLAIALRRVGDLHLAAGRLAEAEPMFAEGADIFVRLLEAEPENRQHESSLAIQYERLGDCVLRRGDAVAARAQYEAAHRIVAEESRRNPDDLLAVERLSIAVEKLADVSASLGEADRAADYAGESARLALLAADRDPNNRGYQLDALYIRGKAARLALSAGRDAADELRAVAEAARRAGEEDPSDAYPAEIEIEARTGLLPLSSTAAEELRAALRRTEQRFAGRPWFAAARKALASEPIDKPMLEVQSEP